MRIETHKIYADIVSKPLGKHYVHIGIAIICQGVCFVL